MQPKSLRLDKEGKAEVRAEFVRVLMEANAAETKAKRSEWADRVFASAFKDDELAAMNMLVERGVLRATNHGYFRDEETGWSSAFSFGDRMMPTTTGGVKIPHAMVEEHEAIGQAEEARNKYILGTLVPELNTIMALSKTRKELAVAWPQVEELMGKEWVEKTDAIANLPTLTTRNLNEALASIKKAA